MGAAGLSRVKAVATNAFRESVRERVLYNLVFFAIVMTLSGLLLKDLSIRQDEKIIKDVSLAAMDFFGTLIALFVGMGLVSKEIEKRSLYPLLAKPVTRGEFLLGKFVGLGFTLAVNILVMTIGMYVTLIAVGARPDPALLGAVYPIYLSLLLVVSVALLFSTAMSPLIGIIATLSVVLAGRYADVIRDMKQVAPGVPGWLIDLLYYALPNFHDFDFKPQVVYGEGVPMQTLAWLTAYTLLYGGAVLALATALFRSKDLQ